MKKYMLVAALLGFGVSVKAEHPGNPDRFPSIGLNYSGAFESGDITVTSGGFSTKQDVEDRAGIITVDTRIPVSDRITLNAAIGFTGSETTADETAFLDATKVSTGGAYLNIGIRFYIK